MNKANRLKCIADTINYKELDEVCLAVYEREIEICEKKASAGLYTHEFLVIFDKISEIYRLVRVFEENGIYVEFRVLSERIDGVKFKVTVPW